MPTSGTGKYRRHAIRQKDRLQEDNMEDEDDLPKKSDWQPKNLEALSIDQLEDYISVLEGEIARVRADIVAKQSDLSAAESIFKK